MQENNKLINSRKQSWIKPIYTFFVVVIPAIFIWLFYGEMNLSSINLEWWKQFLIAIGFVIAILGLTSLLIYFRVFDIFILTFSFPVAICLMMIFVSYPLPIYARALLLIPFIALVFPINIICNKINLQNKIKNKIKKQENNDKIIGHK